MFQVLLISAILCTASASFLAGGHHDQEQPQLSRVARQQGSVPGGVDFSGCVTDPETGLCCVEKEETVTSLEKEPILECTHKNTEQCHYTYVTQFKPTQEEVCEENFEKLCSITFKQKAFNETVKKCYKPIEKVCNGQGPEECRTVYESSCQTKYVEKQPGKSWETPPVRSFLLRSVELAVPSRRDLKNAMRKSLLQWLMFLRSSVTSILRKPAGSSQDS